MISGSLAVVTRINRTARTCSVMLDNGDEIDATYMGPQPPCPLSYVYVDEYAPGLVVVGQERRQVREVFRDDFVASDDPLPDRPGGDHRWRNNAGSTGASIAGNSDGWGSLGIRSAAVLNDQQYFQKIPGSLLLEANRGYWLTSRVHSSALTARILDLGFFDSVGTNGVLLRYDSTVGAEWRLRAVSGGAVTSTALPAGPWTADSSRHYYDLLMVPDAGWCAAWIDGDGPYYVAAGLPAVGVTTGVMYRATATSAVLARIDIHESRLVVISEPVSPLALPSLVLSDATSGP